MANQEHLDILMQGMEVWNQWRREHPDIQPDLSEAHLFKVELGMILYAGPQPTHSEIKKINLSGCDLSRMNLINSNLQGADLSNAILCGSNLSQANLREANLCNTNLNNVFLYGTNLTRADLKGADLSGAVLGMTIFGDVDLRGVQGLEKVSHQGPSIIGTDTLYRSQGSIPDIFLRRAGVPLSLIKYMQSLVETPLNYYTCFISCSTKNQAFAERLRADLLSKDVRCWFAPHDMRTGDKIRDSIDASITRYEKLLLILSKDALESPWVESEVETALEKERQLKSRGQIETVLFPLRLDNTIFSTEASWAKEVRRRHITDFINWKHHGTYHQALAYLLRDLQVRRTC